MSSAVSLDLELRMPWVVIVPMACLPGFFYGLVIAAIVGDGDVGAVAFFGVFGLLGTLGVYWFWRAGTFVDAAGVRIRMFREVRVPWTEVECFHRLRKHDIVLLRSGGDSLQVIGWPVRRFRRNYPRKPKAMMEALLQDLNDRRDANAAREK